MKKLIFLSLLSFMIAGCHSYETRTYDVTVHNQTPGPITIWLTKDGPPYENAWLSPEDLAIESPKGPAANRISGVVVPQGKTASTGPIKGQFEPTTNAILRVYGGQLSFSELLASSPHEGNRTDVTVPPGKSDYTVTGDSSAPIVKESP